MPLSDALCLLTLALLSFTYALSSASLTLFSSTYALSCNIARDDQDGAMQGQGDKDKMKTRQNQEGG